MMTKTLTALSTLGLVIAMQALPASAQVLSANELSGSEFDSPRFVEHSWGLLYVDGDGPQVQYPWAEVNKRLAAKNAQLAQSSRSAGVSQPIAQGSLRGTRFDDPQMARYSWGLMHAPADGPQVQYTWAQIDQQIRRDNAQLSRALSVSSKPVSPDALRGTKFDDPQMVRYSWGLMHIPGDGPQTSYTWSELNGVIDRQFANK